MTPSIPGASVNRLSAPLAIKAQSFNQNSCQTLMLAISYVCLEYWKTVPFFWFRYSFLIQCYFLPNNYWKCLYCINCFYSTVSIFKKPLKLNQDLWTSYRRNFLKMKFDYIFYIFSCIGFQKLLSGKRLTQIWDIILWGKQREIQIQGEKRNNVKFLASKSSFRRLMSGIKWSVFIFYGLRVRKSF